MKNLFICLFFLFLLVFVGCRGTIRPGPSQQITYNDPLTAEGLRKKYPSLRGIVISAEEYWRELEQGKIKEEEYRLSPHIQLQIEVIGEPSLSRTVIVRPDKMVDLPLIGEVRAGDRTIQEFKNEIVERLKKYLKQPQVIVNTVGTTFTPEVYGGVINVISLGTLGGAGGGGASMKYTGVETLVTVLSRTGLSDAQEWHQVRVIRRNPKDPRKGRIILCDAFKLLKFGDLTQDIPMKPGDIVFIPTRWNPGLQWEKEWDLWLKYLGGAITWDAILDWWKSKLPPR